MALRGGKWALVAVLLTLSMGGAARAKADMVWPRRATAPPEANWRVEPRLVDGLGAVRGGGSAAAALDAALLAGEAAPGMMLWPVAAGSGVMVEPGRCLRGLEPMFSPMLSEMVLVVAEASAALAAPARAGVDGGTPFWEMFGVHSAVWESANEVVR